jgi:hypothetical protein
MDGLVMDQMVQVWSLLGTLAGTLLLIALTLWAGTQITRQARALWRAVRGHRAAMIAALDEPTDPVIAALARLSTVPPGVWAAFLPAFVAALADGLDAALADEDGGMAA